MERTGDTTAPGADDVALDDAAVDAPSSIPPAALYMLLRCGVALCFIGHGVFGVLTKEAWLPYFALFGIDAGLAYMIMPLIGAVDILIGSAVLMKPTRVLFAWAAFWCLWTAVLRPLTGEGVWEMLERAGNYGVPFALLVMTMNVRGGWKGWLSSAGLRPSLRFSLPTFRVLQWTTSILLAGHGALMLDSKPAFVEHLAAIGMPSHAAPWIGAFEILLAVAVVARPAVKLLVFVAIWKIGTESLWMAAGDPVWEWIERAGSYAAPLGAALLLRQREDGAHWPGRRTLRLRFANAGGTKLAREHHRSAGAAVLLAGLFAASSLSAQLPPPDAAVLAELRAGGMLLVCRHAITDHSQSDANVDFSDPATQRRLSRDGEAQARELGSILSALEIPIGEVFASPYDRNMRSAELAFGRVTADHSLLTRGDADARHKLMTRPGSEGNRVIMTHERTIHMDLPLERGTVTEGTCIVVRRDGSGRLIPVAQALPAGWARLMGAS